MTEATPALNLKQDGARLILEVLVVPRASKSAMVGVHDGRLKVTLDAPPVDGKANEALISFLAKALKRAKRDVTLLRGEKARQKTLALYGVTVAEVMALISSELSAR